MFLRTECERRGMRWRGLAYKFVHTILPPILSTYLIYARYLANGVEWKEEKQRIIINHFQNVSLLQYF